MATSRSQIRTPTPSGCALIFVRVALAAWFVTPMSG
jgi:hypothetical protein